MTKWVFFDIGDVLFNENGQHEWFFHDLFLTLRRHGKAAAWDTFNAKRMELAALGPNPEAAIKDTLAFFCESDAETETLWKEARASYGEMRRPRPYGTLLDGVTAVLHDLGPDFSLGIVANQHPPVSGALDLYGIRPLFDVVVISEEVGLFKPDPSIFRYALDKAGADAAECVFVGDRPDSDIRPAKSLGMKTVRFRRGLQYVWYNPGGAEFAPDALCERVEDLAQTVRRVAQTS